MPVLAEDRAVSLDKFKTLAEVVKLSAEVYGILVDKKRDKEKDEKDDKIRDLERRIAELEKRGQP